MADSGRITLDVVQAYVSHQVSKYQLVNNGPGFSTEVRAMLSCVSENMVLSMISLFAAENIENIEIKHPLTWWDGFKEQYAPQIWLDRWPVRYRTHLIDVKAIWSGFHPQPGSEKYGPFLTYVFNRHEDDPEED